MSSPSQSNRQQRLLDGEPGAFADASSMPSADRTVLDPMAADVALQRLIDSAKQWHFQAGRLLHATEPMGQLDAFQWLHHNPLGERCLWRGRDGQTLWAGIGAAVVLTASADSDYDDLFTHMHHVLEQHDKAFLGGIAFNHRPGESEWQDFPAARFILPAVALRQQGNHCELQINLYASSHEAFVRQRQQLLYTLESLKLAWPEHAGPVHSDPVQRQDHMVFSACRRRIHEVLRQIDRGELEKAVLARRVDVLLDHIVPAFPVLQRWQKNNQGCFAFAFEMGSSLFMGCTPERLFRREGHRIATEALAGTVARNSNPETDASLARELLNDPKLSLEHQLVAGFIQAQLQPLTEQLYSPSLPGVIKLDRIQHRYLPILGQLRPGVSDAQLLDCLHPTPAVCGVPKIAAQALIQQLEATQRGWYSGAVGLVSPQTVEFAVAIRSALVRGNQVSCFSGVGIVAGSEPETEWQELEAKISSFLDALMH